MCGFGKNYGPPRPQQKINNMEHMESENDGSQNPESPFWVHF